MFLVNFYHLNLAIYCLYSILLLSATLDHTIKCILWFLLVNSHVCFISRIKSAAFGFLTLCLKLVRCVIGINKKGRYDIKWITKQDIIIAVINNLKMKHKGVAKMQKKNNWKNKNTIVMVKVKTNEIQLHREIKSETGRVRGIQAVF